MGATARYSIVSPASSHKGHGGEQKHVLAGALAGTTYRMEQRSKANGCGGARNRGMALRASGTDEGLSR